MSLEVFHKQLTDRRTVIEQSTFDSPPVDWPAFQHRLGGWLEVNRLINDLEAVMKGKEDDQP